MSNKAPLIHQSGSNWQSTLRAIARATDERTAVASTTPAGGLGNSAVLLEVEPVAAAAALLVANFDSLVLDWAARLSVGGINMNFFIIKQLPVLPPETFLEEALPGSTYAELVLPRVLELTYTAHDLDGFARDLGYRGKPFKWNDERRLAIRCELDAVFAHLYKLDRADLEWILDAQAPSESFRGLKENEIRKFGEYRTQRLVLEAYDRVTEARTKGGTFRSLVDPPLPIRE